MRSGIVTSFKRALFLGPLVALWACAPVFAQKDIAGEWDNRFDEDFLERIPGPDIGDYLGMALETASRAFTHLKRVGAIAEPDTHLITIRDRARLKDIADHD